MRTKTRLVLIERFEKVTGRTDCSQIVVLQERARWVMGAIAALAVVVLVIAELLFEPGTVVRALLVGASVGLPLTFLMTGHWLARCGETIVLVRLGRSMAGPHTIVDEWTPPIQASVDSGWVTKRVTVAGRSYILAPTFLPTFRNITGID